jgi:Cu+-exporting ATPase
MKIKCSHCQLEFDKSAMIEKDGKYFCCKGCLGVYSLLQSEHLDSFYDRLKDTKLQPKEELDSSSKFDSESFRERYVEELDNGYSRVSLVIEGIHCSACVWLNEKIIHRTAGVVEADINFTNHKAKIVYDSSVIKLSEIVDRIRSIGYNAYAYDPRLQESKVNKLREDFYVRVAFALFATMNIMWIAVAQYAGFFTGMKLDIKYILDMAEFILATPTLFFSGWIFFKGAYFGLKNRVVNMDFLVSFGATLIYLYSIYAMFSSKHTYFEATTMIITFILVGKYLENMGKKIAVDRLDTLNSSLPTEVMVIEGEERVAKSVDEVKVGDIIEVQAGDKIVVDGVIVYGEASFDTSSLTGESLPEYKVVDDKILSSSVNLDGVIRYKAEHNFKNSTLNSIVTLLEDSLSKKPKIEELANEISKYFSIAVLVVASLTFLGWILYADSSFEKALVISVSVVIIACPCALALATPLATLIGVSLANSHQILFKEASFLETMAKVDLLAIDKTGTLTEGKPAVTRYVKHQMFNKDILYSLLLNSKHPISKGVLEYLKEQFESCQEVELSGLKEISARGIKANYKGFDVLGGSYQFLQENSIELDVDIDFSKSLFLLAIDGRLVALFELEDRLKPHSRELVEKLESMAIEVVMLTGDNEKVASDIASKASIKEFRAKLLPQEKAKFIKDEQERGKIVAMVGDGINDSLAISSANVGITLQSASEISIDVSDVIILNNSLKSLKNSFVISRRVFSFIKQNLSISLIYNLITIPLAIAGVVIPLIAALSMSVSSLLVVANSLRIKSFK